MRLVWSSNEVHMQPWRGCDECGPRMCGVHAEISRRNHARAERHGSLDKLYPLIGPRMRLPQAKDVPEDVILRCLHSQPGKWWTHWPGTDEHMPSLMNVPELSSFPFKVVHAKLCSMERRKLVRGYGGAMSRGDWHVPGVMR